MESVKRKGTLLSFFAKECPAKKQNAVSQITDIDANETSQETETVKNLEQTSEPSTSESDFDKNDIGALIHNLGPGKEQVSNNNVMYNFKKQV